MRDKIDGSEFLDGKVKELKVPIADFSYQL